MKNMIKAVLFDLDGTLLPMDQDVFANAYFVGLAKKAASYGYDAEDLVKSVWAGTAAMVKNDGSDTNEQVFWNCFVQKYGNKVLQDKAVFDEFYENEFEQVRDACGFNPLAATCVETIKNMGYRVVLATNPIFPEAATKARIRWAGLDYRDFEYFTAYENSRHCKPNPEYYMDIVRELNVLPDECMMVGNDVEEDMIAQSLGMKVFLITDCMINRNNKDISVYPSGSFNDLIELLKQMQNGQT